MLLNLTQPMVMSCEPWLLAGQRLHPPVHEQCFMREPWVQPLLILKDSLIHCRGDQLGVVPATVGESDEIIDGTPTFVVWAAGGIPNWPFSSEQIFDPAVTGGAY